MRAAALTVLLSASAFPALALDTPQPGGADPHMRRVAYNPLNRTILIGELTRQTTITFSPAERIGRVVFGQPEADIWEGPDPKDIKDQALQNNLPLWPLKTDPTNMQVTTLLPDGSQRIYQFSLMAKKPDTDGADDPSVTFGLIFTYPAEVKQEAIAAWQARKGSAAKEVAKARLAVDVFYGERNWRYTARPNVAWRENGWPKPDVSDNSQLTAFRFEGNVPTPAIYIVDRADCGPGGNERLAPFSDKDDIKVVQTTAQHFRLRLGDAVLEVCNNGWDAGIGRNPGTGTVSPSVIRQVLSTK